MKIKIDRQKKLQALAVMSFLLLGMGVALLYWILGKDIDLAREQQKVYVQESFVARGLLDQRPSSRAALQLIQKKDPAFVMDALTKLAATNNIRLASLKFSSRVDQKEDLYVRVNFEVQAFGSFKDLGLFLTAVRDMPEGIMDIDGLSVSADNADTARVSAKITFALFEDKGHGQK